MMGSNLLRTALLLGSACATRLALAQGGALGPVEPPVHWLFMPVVAGLGMLLVFGIVAVSLSHDQRKRRERLALVEKLVTTGQPVPRELMIDGPVPLPLPEQRRRDVRRGITLLCLAIAVAAIPIIGSGGEWRYGVWGLLFLLPALGSFLKAHLTTREIARGASNGSPQP